ncbi:MAG: 2-isopropylmalate synthase [Candidatus Buchananbacteria bacterium]
MLMVPKYPVHRGIVLPDRQWPNRSIESCPIVCAVDLRDGNQALPNPMDPDQKLEYFLMLCDLGFKEIEVSFPAASAYDFDFVRKLIEEDLIPDDVFISVLTQCRPDLIAKTMLSLQGVKRAIVHIYIATSDLHIEQVFGTCRESTAQMAVAAANQIREAAQSMVSADIRLEFSPEEFTDTDPDFAISICSQVLAAWGQASVEHPMIVNLPATVERRPPNQVADLFEYFGRHFPNRDQILISCHPHGDQGMANASAELSVLAGADRVEGVLLIGGERTGNVDLLTFLLNFYSRGITIPFDFTDVPALVEQWKKLTDMEVPLRHPYAGELVFTAFSGSHQDAIRKGLAKIIEAIKKFGGWKVPYLHIDPAEIGREYEGIVRLNSQSGKGGLAYVLENKFGIQLPKAFQPVFGSFYQRCVDAVGGEIDPEVLMSWFRQEFIEPKGPYQLHGYWPRPDDEQPEKIHGEIHVTVDNQEHHMVADGDGPIDAFVQALSRLNLNGFVVEDYHESAIGHGSKAQAIAFVPLQFDSQTIWGVGIDSSIVLAAARAIVAALNRKAMAG